LTGNTPGPIDDSTSGTGDPSPPDLGALRRTDELFDALSERRAVSSDDADDPALALLQAFVDDVDVGAPPLSRPDRESRTGRVPRRLPRTLVSLCVATTVLMTTGVAAAGGELTSFAPGQSKSEPRVRIRSDLREAPDVSSKVRYDSGPGQVRRRESVPYHGEAKVDHVPEGLESPRPSEITPSPQPTPYGLYSAPADPPAPAPGSSVSPQPSVTPSGGQGSAQPGGAGQVSPASGLQSPAP
jgi:hypothetical protein